MVFKAQRKLHFKIRQHNGCPVVMIAIRGHDAILQSCT
jgi:hypothetical protein